MKLWLDDVRPSPFDYEYTALSVNAAKMMIESAEELGVKLELIDCDHDLGEYSKYGGDGVRLLDWLEETGRDYPIRIHSKNPVGVENMRRIIRRNGWREVL